MTLPQNPITPKTSEFQSERAISIAGIIITLICAASSIIASAQTNAWQFTVLGIVNLIAAILFLIAYFVNDAGSTTLAGWISLTVVIAIFGITSSFLTSLSIIMVILGLLISINVALQVFELKNAILGTLLSLITLILVFFLGLVLNVELQRVSIPIWAQEVIIIAGGLIGMVLSINTLRRFEFTSLRGQLIIAFLIIAIIPVLVVQVPQLINIQNTLLQTASTDVQENALNAASQLEKGLVSLQTLTITAAKLPVFLNVLQDTDPRSPEIALQTLTALKLQSEYIDSFALLDVTGKVLIDTDPRGISTNEGQESYFLFNLVKRRPAISDVYYNPGNEALFFFISAPIFDEESEIGGVLRARVNGEYLQKEINQQAKMLGDGHVIAVLEQHQVFLAHSTFPELRMRSTFPLSDSVLKSMQSGGLLPSGESDTISVGLQSLHDNLLNLEETPVFEAQLSPSTQMLLTTGRELDIKPWTVIVARSTEAISEPINQQISNIMLILSVVVVAIILGANITAGLITEPMASLVKSAEKIGSGNLSVRVNSLRKDEIGALAHSFDNAADQLQQILDGLEGRVAERTNEIAKFSKQTELRATQLQAIAQVARAISSLQNLDELLPLITERISAAFGYYHVGIFLIDQSGSFAMLQAANSQGGQRMLEKRHRLRVGQTGIVGYVTSAGRPRIALDVGDDAIFFNNPDLPHTRSEMALPLRTGEKIIGALDVQSTEPGAFSEEDINVLSLLADQISVAIQNARLFEETRQALAETRALYSQSVTESWNLLAQSLTRGYRYISGKVEPVTRALDDVDIGQMLEIPVASRGEVFGKVKIRLPEKLAEAISEDDLRLYELIAERLALALDNARLVEESQHRAAIERAISQISGKIGAFTDVDAILQTTVQELGHMVNDSDVIIQLGKQDENPNRKRQAL